jgi:hypothetical protein
MRSTRVIAQKEGIAFLSPIGPALIDKLEAAKSTVVVMPRQKNERLDDIIEFKVAKLAENIKPVKDECKSLHNKEELPAEEPKQEIKRT